MVENKKIIDSKFILEKFGLKSEIYREITKNLEEKIKERASKYKTYLIQWKSFYEKIYGVDIDSNLFLRHSYYATVLGYILAKKLSSINSLNFPVMVQRLISDFKDSNFDEYNYFDLSLFDSPLFSEIDILLDERKFAQQDLFHELYQQIIFPVTRHRIGEFYTSINLVRKMVDDLYELGKKILDPSCGSGNFLVELVLKIIKSKSSETLKIKALYNIFGFDINPIATLTTKVNLTIILLDYFEFKEIKQVLSNILLLDSLFPNDSQDTILKSKKCYNSFDLVIGNPPWLTYKDLGERLYQKKVRELANNLKIKPSSQYITHIELATIFFYAIPYRFLKLKGKIFFVITKSVLNGDHCYNFRSFSSFNEIEIWDFPKNYFFNVDHICLKATYVGFKENEEISDKYPIITKILDNKLNLLETIKYTSVKIESDGAKIILPEKDVNMLNNLTDSPYKKKFFQGATLVPRALVFFHIEKENETYFTISSDKDIISRAKKKWKYSFKNKVVEKKFCYKTFLNKDLIPFLIKRYRNVFLPINSEFQFDMSYLKKNQNALNFYKEINLTYQKNKKETSKIDTLIANLNYWNKLSKQVKSKQFITVYNASGSNLKAAVINNEKKDIIIDSENYYFSTNSMNEAYFLSAILNSPIISKYIKLIKSSRHIHKRPFSFNIPLFDDMDEIHRKLAKKGYKYQTIVQDLAYNNPKINPEKVRLFLYPKLEKLNSLSEKIVLKS
ncbi:MAG: Eco57I restriction-modification methylase domain-containing protein [Candidatus Hodarchaeota archaeon]